jgi:energy-coupling factor transporter ATP-binding protein EcfA2
VKRVRLLFLAANPFDTDRLALDKEIREIKARLRGTRYGRALKIESDWAVRPGDLLLSLGTHRPTVVHFAGHGEKNRLLLQDEQGATKPVAGDTLVELFREAGAAVRLVFFNTCSSAPLAGAVTEVVECAVGMKGEAEDEAAICFVAAFYQAIGLGHSVAKAFAQGKLALRLEGHPPGGEPVLFHRPDVDATGVFLVSARRHRPDGTGDASRPAPDVAPPDPPPASPEGLLTRYAAEVVRRHATFVPLGLDRPIELEKIYRDLAIYRQFSSPYYKSREELVAELDAESRGDLLDRIQGRLERAINALLAEFESVATGQRGQGAAQARARAAAVARLTEGRPLIDELLGLGSAADLEGLLCRRVARDVLGGFLADLAYQDGVFLRLLRDDLDRLPDDLVAGVQRRYPLERDKPGAPGKVVPRPMKDYLAACQEDRARAAESQAEFARQRKSEGERARDLVGTPEGAEAERSAQQYARREREQAAVQEKLDEALALVERELLAFRLADLRGKQRAEGAASRTRQVTAWRDKVVAEIRAYEARKERVSFEFALETWRRIVILGHPGSGKSTLLQHKAFTLAKKGASPLPLLVRLRHLNRGGKTLRDLLVEELRLPPGSDAGGTLEALLGAGKLMLFLDGLDEVDEERRNEVAGDIERLLAQFPEARCVVTCRILGYHSLLPYKALELAELDAAQVRSFVEAWFAETGGRAEGVFEGIQASQRLWRMCRNPFLLTLYCIVRQKAPARQVSRSALYGIATAALMEANDKAKGIRRNRHPFSLKAALLTRLADGLHRAARELFTLDDAIAAAPDAARPEDVLDEIVNNSGIVRQLSNLDYGFAHLSLQEYYAALAQGDGVRLLAGLDTPRYWELIRLWCGTAAPHHAEALIDRALAEVGGRGWQYAAFVASCVAELARPPAGLIERTGDELLQQLHREDLDGEGKTALLEQMIELAARDAEGALHGRLRQLVGQGYEELQLGVAVILGAGTSACLKIVEEGVGRLRYDQGQALLDLTTAHGTSASLTLLKNALDSELAPSALDALASVAQRLSLDVSDLLADVLCDQPVAAEPAGSGFYIRLSDKYAPGEHPGAEAILHYWLLNVKAYTSREKVKDPTHGRYEEPDERFMRQFERVLDIPEGRKDDFRREVMNALGAAVLDGQPLVLDRKRFGIVVQALVEGQLGPSPWRKMPPAGPLWEPPPPTPQEGRGVRVGERVLFPTLTPAQVVQEVCHCCRGYFTPSLLALAFREVPTVARAPVVAALAAGLRQAVRTVVRGRISLGSFLARAGSELRKFFTSGAPPEGPPGPDYPVLALCREDVDFTRLTPDCLPNVPVLPEAWWLETELGRAIAEAVQRHRRAWDLAGREFARARRTVEDFARLPETQMGGRDVDFLRLLLDGETRDLGPVDPCWDELFGGRGMAARVAYFHRVMNGTGP